jgi:DedD protein
MAESHEPSYYEIALTNRQVIVAFVLLLGCLLTAFFSGVWIGRESTARSAQDQLVRNEPPPKAAPKEGRSMDELEFFDRNPKQGEEQTEAAQQTTPPTAPRNGSDTTLLEDFAGRDTPDRSRNPEPAAVEPSDEPAPVPVPAEEETAAERRERRKRQREEREAKAEQDKASKPAPAKTAAKTTPEPSVPKGSVVIQVFSSPDRAQADSIRGRLSGGGQKAYISPIERGGRTMYRVRLGPFKSRDDAQKVADQVRKKYKLDTWVTE